MLKVWSAPKQLFELLKHRGENTVEREGHSWTLKKTFSSAIFVMHRAPSTIWTPETHLDQPRPDRRQLKGHHQPTDDDDRTRKGLLAVLTALCRSEAPTLPGYLKSQIGTSYLSTLTPSVATKAPLMEHPPLEEVANNSSPESGNMNLSLTRALLKSLASSVFTNVTPSVSASTKVLGDAPYVAPSRYASPEIAATTGTAESGDTRSGRNGDPDNQRKQLFGGVFKLLFELIADGGGAAERVGRCLDQECINLVWVRSLTISYFFRRSWYLSRGIRYCQGPV